MARDWQVQGLLPGAGGSLPAPFDGAQHGPHFVVALPSTVYFQLQLRLKSPTSKQSPE